MIDTSYDRIIESNAGFLLSHYETSIILNLVVYPLRKTILDVGRGTGRIAISLDSLGNQVFGIVIDWH